MKKALAMVNPASGSSRFLAFCCAILFMVLLPGLLLAGTGIIKGKVTDRDTKQGLPSANIIIKGTRIGTTADLDGNFTIPNAPTGQQTITVSYIGYATVNIPVTVKEDGVVRHDFALRAEALKGKEYVITAQAQVNIASVSPALYTANANGAGVPAARAIFVAQGGAQSNPAVFQCGASGCLPVALSLGGESEALYLELYGTGIRGRSALSAVKATIGGVSAEVFYAGANPNFVGLDQVNVKVPRSLLHRGEVQLLLTVDGQQANPVGVRFK